MINYDEINDFIIKVFNYYNGRINVINKAVLDVNWANLIMNDAGGYSRLPNIVTINPMVIIRYNGRSNFSIKMSIIETIIHELYHTDQMINYTLYESDINYKRFIEHACEVQTAIYISGHALELYNEFGIKCARDTECFNKCMMYWDIPGIRYQRRYYHDHIFMCIDDICNIDMDTSYDIYDFIKHNVENHKNIILTINNERINVCFNNCLISIDEFNEIILKYVCTGVHMVKYNFEYNRDTYELILNIQTEVLNLMCKKV